MAVAELRARCSESRPEDNAGRGAYAIERTEKMSARSKSIRIGMIGCGGNARGHMRRLVNIEGAEIVALCDPSKDAVKATHEAVPQTEGLPTFMDHKKLLAEAKLDAVVISTPHTLHYEQIVDSLGAGVHVCCEKPMVCTVAHARSVIEQAEKSGKVMMVSYQRHCQAPYRYCRELIASGETGQVNFITALQSQNWYRNQVGRGTWRSKMKWSGGGQLNDSGSHLLDIVLWMSGLQPAEVFAYQNNLGAEVDILSAIDVRFDGGALSTFSVVGHAVNFFEEITVWCEDATIAIRGPEVWLWRGKDKQIITGEELGRTWTPDENFIAAIRGKEEVQSTPEDALKVIQLSEASWASAESGKPEQVER